MQGDQLGHDHRGLGAVFSDSYVLLAFALLLLTCCVLFSWHLSDIVLLNALVAGWRSAWSP
jgi:hypothetical protein